MTLFTKEAAEKLGWVFNDEGTTAEKSRFILMMPTTETLLQVIKKREGQ